MKRGRRSLPSERGFAPFESNNKKYIYYHIYITTEKIPDIKPIKLKEYNLKQSKYNMVGRIPIRQIVLGPSGCGKGIYIQK